MPLKRAGRPIAYTLSPKTQAKMNNIQDLPHIYNVVTSNVQSCTITLYTRFLTSNAGAFIIYGCN